jgi:transcriptional regulator with XRE-family HTH domain
VIDLGILGREIQQLRTDRQLTLQQLAANSKVSVSMLSSVERAEKAPTIVVLARIAQGLGVALPRLLGEPDQESILIRRANEQEVIDEPGGWRRVIVSPVIPGVNFEWIRTTLPPGCMPGLYPAYAPGSHEYVFVERGSVRITVGDSEIDLAAGESMYFAGNVVHGYANTSRETCTYYVAALIMRPRRPSSTMLGLGRDPEAPPTPR